MQDEESNPTQPATDQTKDAPTPQPADTGKQDQKETPKKKE